VATGLTVREPTTTLTDVALAIVGGWFSLALVLQPHTQATHLWAEAFGCGAIGALLGAVAHGFVDHLSPRAHGLVWKGSLMCAGAAAIVFAAAAARSATPAPMRGDIVLSQVDLIVPVAFIAVALYVVAVIFRPTFATAAVASSMALGAMLIAAIFIARSSPAGSAWLMTAVALSAVGFTVQWARISVHRYLNHNDLYHLLQLVALVCLYLAAVTLT
jgi:hypothetical protein